ncbi:MAG: extracellular solute-binding protein [Sulfitobacter sp.]|nr:extracellular solute-binding protein [Sulfitobacter sp.]
MTRLRQKGFALGAVGILLGSAAIAQDADLTVFDWAGYEDPAFYTAFTDAHGQPPTFAFFGDEEEAFQKLRSGFKADAAHPCSQSVPKWMEAGLLAPLDISRIDRWEDVNEGFREIEAYKKDGEYYFVPMDWGNTGLVYNTDKLSEEQASSLQLFADPSMAGKISMPDNVDDAYALGFLATGVTDWTQASDEDFQEASDFLRKVHQNVLSYWDSSSSLAQLMQSGQVEAAWAWNETAATLSAEGLPIAMKRDAQEGASSWVCGYVKLKDGPGSDDKFYDFINAWLEPETADYMVSAWGYGHSNATQMEQMDQELLASMSLQSNDALRENTLWQGPAGNELREKMIAEWENIKAGF